MDFSSFDIAWKNFQQSSELMHLAVQQWRKEDARDPAILGLIALYDDCGKNPEMVLQQLNIAKKKVMQGNSQFKIKIVRFSAAAAILLLLGWAGWWILGTQDQVTWSYTDEGIPQLMDEKVGVTDWSTINYSFQQGDFDRCIELLNHAKLKQPMNDTLLYYSAYCYLRLEERDSARKYFSLVPPIGSVYSLKSKYFNFHLIPEGPDYMSLAGLSNIQDPILRQAVKRDIAR